MYIWIGIDVDDQLADIRERVGVLEKALKIANSNLTLPFHISLKISFPLEGRAAQEAIEAVERYYRTLPSFAIPVAGIEYHESICWIRMQENKTLNRIHDELNQRLLECFGVGLHPYDEDYLFHTTLFMDDDTKKVYEAYQAVKDEPLPAVLYPSAYLIGTSENGALGTYHIKKRVPPAQDLRGRGM